MDDDLYDDYAERNIQVDNEQGKHDIEELKAAGKYAPETAKEKDLRACTGCNLIMSDRQWNKITCPNCQEIRQDWGTTRYFSGMISLFMVSNSWVAQYNGLKNRKPGVYAVRIMTEDYYDEDDGYD